MRVLGDIQRTEEADLLWCILAFQVSAKILAEEAKKVEETEKK